MDDAQITEIDMFVGESRVFPTPGVARIAVGNGGILTASALDGKEVILFANGAGTSSLFVWNDDGRYQRVKINIVPGDTGRFAREIASFLSTMPNARTSVIADKVVVEGDDLSDADLEKIGKLAEKYPQILNFTNTVGWDQMVLMDVKVVEFPTSVLKEVGLKWSSNGGAAVGGIWSPSRRGHDGPYEINIPAGERGLPIDGLNGQPPVLPRGLNILSGVNLGLGAQLNLLAQDGKASLLAEPQLSARNGATASFLAGGEIPYAVTSLAGPTIVFKPYGVKLEIQPRVDRNGVIRAKIETEVSSIDASVGNAIAGPGLLSRKTKTEFNLRAGETLVLGGLLQRNASNDIDKVPLLGDIPIIGALFRSKRFQNKETELVVFVTPTVVDARSPGMVDRVEKTQQRLKERLGDVPHLSEPLQPGVEPAGTGRTAQAQDAKDVSHRAEANAPTVASPASASAGSSLQVREDGLVLRQSPGRDGAPLLRLGVGAFVQLGDAAPQVHQGVLWRNVVVGELNGWTVASGLAPWKLDDAAPTASAFADVDRAGRMLTTRQARAPLVSQAPQRYSVALFKLALRVAPDTNAQVLTHLQQNETVVALPEPRRGHWTAVEARGQRGWVASQWLRPSQEGVSASSVIAPQP